MDRAVFLLARPGLASCAGHAQSRTALDCRRVCAKPAGGQPGAGCQGRDRRGLRMDVRENRRDRMGQLLGGAVADQWQPGGGYQSVSGGHVCVCRGFWPGSGVYGADVSGPAGDSDVEFTAVFDGRADGRGGWAGAAGSAAVWGWAGVRICLSPVKNIDRAAGCGALGFVFGVAGEYQSGVGFDAVCGGAGAFSQCYGWQLQKVSLGKTLRR